MKFSEMPYERIDFKKLTQDFKDLEDRLEKAKSGEEQFRIHQEFYLLYNHVMTESQIAMIRSDIDMSDEKLLGELEYFDENMPIFQNLVVSYRKKLFNSPFRPYLEEKIGKVAFKNIELAMKAVDDKLIPLMQEENKLQTEYNKLLAGARIDWNGEELNLSLMSPYLNHKDRSIRKEAWEKFSAFFETHQEELDDFYDKLVKNRTKQGELMGHENYLPLGYARMNRNSFGRSDIQEFRKQVKRDFVPFAEKLHDLRRRQLGLNKLSYIDEGVYFTNGNPAPVGTPEQILAAGQKMYNDLSPETGRFINFMCDSELFDVLGRKNKKTGGYMTMLPDYHAPFVFANFNGTSGDADVITHECGHAFQGYITADDPIIEHNDITMEIAETHSMSMEFFTEPWMPLIFGNRSDDYIKMHFMDAVMFIPYGTMVDEFQDIIYSDPGLSPKARNEVWRELERQYKPHLDYTGNAYYEHGGYWQRQHHIYDSPLYYIDYCIAGANSLQYKVRMDRDYREAWDSYLKLCKLSASDFYNELMKKAGLDNVFEDGCLRYIVKKLDERF